jgi:hypothetical protein
MGCGNSKDLPPVDSAAQNARYAKKRQICDKIVEALDTNHDGIMQAEEVQSLVKNIHPKFIDTPASKIELTCPEVMELDGKTKTQLAEHLCNIMDDGWVHAYAMFLGVIGDEESIRQAAADCQPGVYEVKWPGGVRFRTTNRYRDVCDKRSKGEKGSADYVEEEVIPRAKPGQTYRIRFFVKGDMKFDKDEAHSVQQFEVPYGYCEWPRLFLPMCFPDGEPTMQRIADYDEPAQLQKMCDMIFDEMLKTAPKDATGVKAETIINYLEGAKIGYNKDKLANDLDAYDKLGNGDGLIQKDEFFECFTKTQSISDCLWIDTNFYDNVPHPEAVEGYFPKDSPSKKLITHESLEQL